MGFGKDGKGEILYDSVNGQPLGTLASQDVVLLPNNYDGGVLVDDFRIIKMDYMISVRPAQAVVVFDGPVIIGIAQGNLTAAQIEECIETTVLNRGQVESENAMRPVWPLEIIMLPDPDAQINELTRKGSINLRWTFPNPSGWVWWAWNKSGFALVTGSTVEAHAKIFGVWVS